MKFAFTNSSGQFDARRLFISLGMLMAFSWSGLVVALPVTPQIAAAGGHTAHLQSDGTLWAWGKNSNGQIGDGTSIDRSAPVQVGSDNDWVAIAAGGDYYAGTSFQAHTLAVKLDGTLWAWGANSFGQLGNNSNVNRYIPTRIGTTRDWKLVFAGPFSSYGIKVDGSLWAWGKNNGRLGDGSFENRSIPVRIGVATNWKAIATGIAHTIGIKTNGTLWGWGHNSEYWPLGTALLQETYAEPAQIGVDTDWVAIAAGREDSMALKANGKLYGSGFGLSSFVPAPHELASGNFRRLGPDSDWDAATAGHLHFLARKRDGTLWGWGSNEWGQLGLGSQDEWIATPQQIGTRNDWGSVAAGSLSSAALSRDDSLFTWGENRSGQLGDGTVTRRPNPSEIPVGPGWVEVAAGSTHTTARKTDGSLWAWGENERGALGDGTFVNRSTPVRVGTASNWLQITAGDGFSAGIQNDRSLWAWGAVNVYVGQPSPIPSRIGFDSDWAGVAAGFNHTVALKTNGSLWGWGYNLSGQIGDGSTTERLLPVRIGTATNWKSVAPGRAHTIGLKTDGSLWAWGGNTEGQLGLGNTDSYSVPVRVGTENNWVMIAAGSAATAAIKLDGSLWVWGAGALGDGSTAVRLNPVRVGTDSDWRTVEIGWGHVVATRSDGTAWAWGGNSFGQVGDGTFAIRLEPFNVGTDTDWQMFAAGQMHTVGLRNNGTLVGWGEDYNGQLAGGDTNPGLSLSPPMVTSFPQLVVYDSVPYQYLFSATDTEPVLLSAEILPVWLSFNASTRFLSGTPPPGMVGQHAVILRASDGNLVKRYAFIIDVVRNPLHDQALSLRFDEGSGYQSNDDSFTGLSAALNNVKWSFSFSGNAISLNSAGFASVPDNNALDSTNALTLEAWVNPTANNQSTYIIAKNYDAASQFAYGLGLRAGKLHATLNNVIHTSTYVVPRNKWTHVAAVWDGAMLRLYVNGAQVFSKPVGGTLPANSQRLIIGARNANGTGFAEGFVGAIDGVQLWKIALSPQALCFEAGRTWNGSACTGEVFNNSTPTANSATFSTTLGKVLNGTLSATNPDSDPLTFLLGTGPLKGTVQITNASTGAFRYVPSATGADSFTFRVTDYFGISGLATVNVNVTAGAALDSDGDGMIDVTEAQHGLNPASPADGPQDKDHDTLSNYNEVIANRNPTIPFETDALHVLGMSFREGAGTAPRDATNAGNHGTFNGTKAKWSAGPFGNAFSTTATAGVTIPDKASLDITGALSIELWIKPITSNQTSYLVAKNSDTGAGTFDYGFALGGGKLRAILTGNTYTTGYIVPVNEWTHVALTWDAAKVRIYANGNVVYTANRTAVMTANAKPLIIGARNTPAGALTQGFTGELDQVNVWRRALSGSEMCTASGGVLSASVCAH